MLIPIILLCIAVICLACPPSDPRSWAALVFAIVALVRRKAMAQAVCIVVVGGTRGSGFSCQIMGSTMEQQGLAKAMAATFRQVAEEIEANIAQAVTSDPSTLPKGTVRVDTDDD